MKKVLSMKYKVSSINKSKIWFLLFFIVLGFVVLQIPVNVLEGAKVKFTLFDLFAPISAAFLGSYFGIIAVLLMQAVNLFVNGFGGVQTDSVLKLAATLRFLPLAFGVWYFALAQKKPGNPKLILSIPLLSIIVFNLHPVGRTVWFYSLFWFIPLLVWPLRERFLLARSFGSTFTAHAVGGAVWIWAFNLPANVWVSLIPIVVLERSIFALGISASYIFLNNILAVFSKIRLLAGIFSFDKKYVLGFLK